VIRWLVPYGVQGIEGVDGVSGHTNAVRRQTSRCCDTDELLERAKITGKCIVPIRREFIILLGHPRAIHLLL
jgi:hypothetical protein